jgi:hypothetical protein
MNKDVIYIDPEDDITDIISRIKGSKRDTVALVPPKNPGILRSVVNFKLLSKASKETDKTLVLITTDESMIKLASSTDMLVANNLQAKPETPKPSLAAPTPTVTEDKSRVVLNMPDKKPAKDLPEPDEALEDVVQKSNEKDKKEEKEREEEEEKERKKIKIPDFKKFKKFLIPGAAFLIALIVFLIWAFAFAPGAEVTVMVKTTNENFSESVSFVKTQDKSDPAAGVFFLETHKITKETSVEFEGTGIKDVGTKATGTINLIRNTSISHAYYTEKNIVNTSTPTISFNEIPAVDIPKGTIISYGGNGKNYIVTEDARLDGISKDDANKYCDTFVINDLLLKKNMNCASLNKTVQVNVEAQNNGEDYNLGPTNNGSGWSISPATQLFSVKSSASLAGGVTKTVAVVDQVDIDIAKSKIEAPNEAEAKTELLATFPTSLAPISNTVRFESADPVANVKVGDEMEGVTGNKIKPKLVMVTTISMYGVDRSKLDEFIQIKHGEKIKSRTDQKIYSTGVSQNKDENKAFIEQYVETAADSATGKLKSVVAIGPKISEEDVWNKVRGKKIGDARSQLKSINGVSDVNIKTTVPWVSSVPDNAYKVTIRIKFDE